jgi:hypothetical protein
MKRTHAAALVALLAVAPTAALAQDAPARAFGASPRALAAAQAELGLSAGQVQQLEAIAARLQAQNAPLLEQLRERGFGARAAAQGQRMQRMTPEQREQMRERMQRTTPEQREQMRERMQQMTPEQRAQMRERMQRTTPEQREQMRERMQQMTPEQREQMRERMQRRGGQGTARGEMRVPEAVRPVLQQLQANNRAALQEAQAVLTPEQRERAGELMRQRVRERRGGDAAGWQRGARGERRDGAAGHRFRGAGGVRR